MCRAERGGDGYSVAVKNTTISRIKWTTRSDDEPVQLTPRDNTVGGPRDLLRSWPWASPSGHAALVALGFALGTCCARSLGLRPRDSLGTRCTCGIRLCPQDSLRSWPWASSLGLAALVTSLCSWTRASPSGLNALVSSGFVLRLRCTHGLRLRPGYQMDYVYCKGGQLLLFDLVPLIY